MNKTCSKCNETKSVYAFRRDVKTLDNVHNPCRQCEKEWRNSPAGKESNAKSDRRRRIKFPERKRARTAVGNAVKTGKLVRPESCSKCDSKKQIEAHHPDYSKLLDVIWLCTSCHQIEHATQYQTKQEVNQCLNSTI